MEINADVKTVGLESWRSVITAKRLSASLKSECFQPRTPRLVQSPTHTKCPNANHISGVDPFETIN